MTTVGLVKPQGLSIRLFAVVGGGGGGAAAAAADASVVAAVVVDDEEITVLGSFVSYE